MENEEFIELEPNVCLNIRDWGVGKPIVFIHGWPLSPKLGEWFQNMGMEASPHATEACLHALKNSDLRDTLLQVNVPTKIFHGIQDKICPFELAEAMASGIKDSEVVTFKNSGHGLFYEERDKFNTEIMNFVG